MRKINRAGKNKMPKKNAMGNRFTIDVPGIVGRRLKEFFGGRFLAGFLHSTLPSLDNLLEK